MHTIHILNGDSTAYVFKQTNISGDVLIWREILSEGPVSTTDLWTIRAAWMSENFGVNDKQYEKDVKAADQKLREIGTYDQILLWFEYDLLCQINLIFILSELDKAPLSQCSIYLICPEKIKGMPNFRGLGELSPEQLTDLLSTKVKLEQADLNFATNAWEIYVNNDPLKISTLLAQDFGNLPLLRKALKAHLQRFPDPISQLNGVAQLLLEIYKSGIRSKNRIYEAFWEQAPIYGMGDLQIDLVLNQLQAKGLIKDLY